jgi:hypothetical protein
MLLVKDVTLGTKPPSTIVCREVSRPAFAPGRELGEVLRQDNLFQKPWWTKAI